MIQKINRFSTGSAAENFVINYFTSKQPSISFINWDKKNTAIKNPEGYLTFKKRKIAVIEIKNVKYKQRKPNSTFNSTKRDINTIHGNIKKGINQLCSETSSLPKLLFIHADDPIVNEHTLQNAILGRMITTFIKKGNTLKRKSRRKIYLEEAQEYYKKLKQVNGIICLYSKGEDFESIIFRNELHNNIPKQILNIINPIKIIIFNPNKYIE